MENVWNYLIQYESRDLVERAYQKRHNRELNAKNAKEIIASFIQAREYFLNTERSAITVKPLLQYYGVNALSRGLILMLSRNGAETLKPGHGLDTENWQNTLANGILEIGNLSVQICKGTFLHLIQTTENKGYFRSNSSAVNWKVDFELPGLGSSLIFENLSRSNYELKSEFVTWKNNEIEEAKLISVIPQNDERYDLTFSKVLSHEAINELFPNKESILSYKEENSATVVTLSQAPLCFSQYSGWLDIGDVMVVPPMNGNICLNEISLYYALSYILGMLARYFPATWISLGRAEKGDAIFPLINKLLDLIQNRFPQIVEDFLKSPYDFENKS